MELVDTAIFLSNFGGEQCFRRAETCRSFDRVESIEIVGRFARNENEAVEQSFLYVISKNRPEVSTGSQSNTRKYKVPPQKRPFSRNTVERRKTASAAGGLSHTYLVIFSVI